MIELKGITKKFAGELVFENFDLTVAEGDFLCLAGPSGVGKTTMLNVMSLIERPTEGKVKIDGISKWSSSVIQKLRREKIGYVFQNYGLIENDNVEQNLLLTSKFAPFKKSKRQYVFVQALIEVGLDESYLRRKIYSLSGGEQQRVALARLLITRPKYIFADELTGNLDADNREVVFGLLERFVQQGHTVVYVSHDAALIERGKRVVRLEKG
ncbi:MAG: ATP-binding cassette domain-containing protein [Lactobacillales bacterium]|jgi:putative ABC transport system ATP-binding protein|nr:ATP-binding cassette domain-containing protein [Lactobacillales bacterium]